MMIVQYERVACHCECKCQCARWAWPMLIRLPPRSASHARSNARSNARSCNINYDANQAIVNQQFDIFFSLFTRFFCRFALAVLKPDKIYNNNEKPIANPKKKKMNEAKYGLIFQWIILLEFSSTFLLLLQLHVPWQIGTRAWFSKIHCFVRLFIHSRTGMEWALAAPSLLYATTTWRSIGHTFGQLMDWLIATFYGYEDIIVHRAQSASTFAAGIMADQSTATTNAIAGHCRRCCRRHNPTLMNSQ